MFTAHTVTADALTHPIDSSGAGARRPLWKHGLAASCGAAAATTSLAALASSAGVSFADRSGAAIPIVAFAQLTLVFSLLGVLLGSVLARRARRPRTVFLCTTGVLTTLSVVPDLTFGFSAASAATLIALHLVAALIVVPVVARRLPRER